MLRLAIFSISLTGCFIEESHGTPACVDSAITVDIGATIDHVAGVDAGYYASYAAGGHWHFEWTCDTKLSAIGCNFTGSILADTPPGGVAAGCVACEDNDVLTTTPVGAQTRLDFDTVTSTGIDGVDFVSVPGNAINIDLQINGLYQNDLVFLPSGGRAVTQACMPIDLVPSAP